jgi:predicted regulator of Ras-like GTPase activity (Roadblock/LC7/MglB family)/Tfp pilus assembly protein PilF
MKSPAPAELQRWSEEVARDPASLAFVPLARAYRRMGKPDASLRLCLRGLERHPTHVEAHGLLALLYLDKGDRARAADEWGMVLRLEPDNFEALRGMGFHYLEQSDIAAARRHLLHASEQKPNDPAVREALNMLAEIPEEPQAPEAPQELSAAARNVPSDPWATPDPWAGGEVFTPEAPAAPAPVAPGPRWSDASVEADPWTVRDPFREAAATPAPSDRQVVTPPAPGSVRVSAIDAQHAAAAPARQDAAASDPSLVFETLRGAGPFIGALLLDEQGLVLAGTLASNDGSEESLGAILGGAIEEASRTASHLSLGRWRGILLEAEKAVVHLTPVGTGLVVLIAAQRSAPTGWVLRTAQRATALATQYLGDEA